MPALLACLSVRAALAAIAVLIALAALPAHAATTLVLFDPADDLDASLDRIRDAYRQQKGRHAVLLSDFRPLDEVLPPGQRLFVLGPVSPLPCALEFPVTAQAFTNLVRDGTTALAWLEFATVEGTLVRAGNALPCLDSVADRESLSRYQLLRGVSAFYSRGPASARAEFRQGLLVSPFLQWDPDHPPEAEEAFRQAVGDALRTGRGLLSIAEGVVSEGTLWIDGEPVDSRTRTRDLFEGLHLLQWGTSDRFVTLQTPIAAGQEAGLAHRSDLARALTTREAGRLTEAWLADRLDAQAAKGGWEDVVVVGESGGSLLFHRYLPGERVWVEARPEDLLRRIEDGRRMRSQGLTIGLGGAAVALLGVGMTWAGLVNGLDRPAEALSATVGLVLVGVGGAGTLAGIPLLARGDAMAKGRDRDEVLRYRTLAHEGRRPGHDAARGGDVKRTPDGGEGDPDRGEHPADDQGPKDG